MMVGISSLFALFIGMFIIYNSFAIAVTQRRSEIGILRALGATRGQIRWLFLGESAVTGLIGSIGGLAVRHPHRPRHRRNHRRADLGRVRRRAARRRGVDQPRAAPAGAGHRHRHEHRRRGDPRAQRCVGRSRAGAAERQVSGPVAREKAACAPSSALLLGAVSVVCLGIGSSRPVFYAGYALAIVVALLISPLLSLMLAKALRPILKWARPVEGALAADSLIQSPRRTSASVAALMLSLALVIAFAGMARASYASIIDWMETALNPGALRHAVAEHRGPNDAVPGVDGSRGGRDSGSAARADGARRARHVPEDTGHGGGGRGQQHGGDRAAAARRRKRRRDVPPRVGRRGADRRRQPGAACST